MTKYCDLCNRDITKPEAHFLEDCSYFVPKIRKPGYHKAKIKQGTFGEADKIMEECEEFMDAIGQHTDIMALTELSDMIGAMRGYLEKHHPSITIDDLCMMATATRRAFENGHRK